MPELPRYLLDAVEQQARLLEDSGLRRTIQQIAADYDRLGPAWDEVVETARRHQATFSAIARQIGGTDGLLSRAGIGREAFDREVGSLLHMVEVYAPGAINASHAAEQALREALSGGLSDEVRRLLGHVWTETLRSLTDYGSRWFEELPFSLPPTDEELEESRREQLATASALAEAGWTIPLTFSPRQVEEAIAVGRANGLSALDQEMVALYGLDDGREFAALATTLRHRYTAKKRRRWYPVLVESLSCYRAGCYRASALLSIALLERGVADVVGIANMGGRRPTLKGYTWARWKAREDAKASRLSFFLDSLSCSVGKFIACLWQDSPFIGPHPRRPNRHRGVHGRDPNFGTQADALRLLIALDTLGYLSSEMRRSAFARRRGRGRR